MSNLVKRTTLHGLNYYISEETDKAIYMAETMDLLKAQGPNGMGEKEHDISIIIESSNLLPSLLGFIAFIVIMIMSFSKGIPNPWYMVSIICLIVYLFGVVNRHTLFFYTSIIPIIPLLCMTYNFITTKIPFIHIIIILLISHFIFHNILIGIVYLVGTILLSMIIPHDSVYFNDKVVRYVYGKK